MKAIVCVDKNWGIGKKNGLLFRLPADMKYFMSKTLGKVVVMGGNTLLSFPGSKPLKNRINIVISDVFTRDDCICVDDLPKLCSVLKNYNTDDTFVIGGAMLYRTLLPYCDTVYVTKVDADGAAEVFYENLDEKPQWQMVEQSSVVDDNGYRIRFTTYKNSEPKAIII